MSENEVVGSEQLSVFTGLDGIHSSWLEIDQDSSWNIFVACDRHKGSGGFVALGKAILTGSLVEVDTDSLELEVVVSNVSVSDTW